ncbi:MAG TPA: S8 family serine peptidase, partial [Gaiellaceae bacterium]|nr:S8 family serine peptidase [Gaiellaceae bacterium]
QACGPAGDPNGRASTLPAHSLDGAVALAWRGGCTFDAKARHLAAAGAIGVLLVDNRPGEPNQIPVDVHLPAAMIADLDGARLHAFAAASGGRTTIRVGTKVEEIVTGRGDTITSFSSAGPSAFGHQLKPDLAAPGGQILSSTPPLTTGSTFSVFDGTSMATPHVAGAAALLLELHPGWTAEQVKSALVSTAGPAWEDTAQTHEASVLLAGGGLADLPAANDPRLFTEPTSLSFGDVNVSRSAARKPLLVSLADAGGGGGTWQVELRPQAATSGAVLEVPTSVDVLPGGFATIAVTASAAADAAAGWDYGFLVLRLGTVERRVPYAFFVTRPQLPLDGQPVPLRKRQRGDTRQGAGHVSVYCCPSDPFGPPPGYTGPGTNESGAERVYVSHVNFPVANAGVSILQWSPGSIVHPWYLGALDEGTVQGAAGTPVNVNDLMADAKVDIGAAGVVFPRQGEFFVAVDSASDFFTGRPLPGRYLLNSWVNDVTPPRVRLLTAHVSAGRPTVVALVTDLQSGVDPLSLTLSYHGALVGAEAFDPLTGVAVFPLRGSGTPSVAAGSQRATIVASDFQETKNVSTYGPSTMPNTTYRRVTLRVVAGPTVAWLTPSAGACVRGRVELRVSAGSTAAVRVVRFLDGKRQVAAVRREVRSSVYAAAWRAGAKGRHLLRAVVVDAKGRSAVAERVVRAGCG